MAATSMIKPRLSLKDSEKLVCIFEKSGSSRVKFSMKSKAIFISKYNYSLFIVNEVFIRLNNIIQIYHTFYDISK